MSKNDLYTRKTEEKLKKAKSDMFTLWLRAANSPYDIKTAYPRKLNALQSRIGRSGKIIKNIEEKGQINNPSPFQGEEEADSKE